MKLIKHPKTVTELQGCVVTNQMLSEMLNNRGIHTRLAGSVISLSTCYNKVFLYQKQNYNIHTKPKQFLIGDPVWIRNFRRNGLSFPSTI